MKQFWSLFGKFLSRLGVIAVLAVIILISVATISGDNGTLNRLIMGTELRLKSTASIRTYGNSYIDFGDSSYVVRGARFAGVDSFATTQTSDTIAFSGIAAGSIFEFTEIKKSATASADTIIFHYFTKTDTCFVYRAQRLATSSVETAPNYAWIRVK